MAKRKKSVPKDETKRDKFKRIVEPRVRKALKAIRLVGNCSGSAYEYTEDDVHLIMMSIEESLRQLQQSYQTKGVQDIDFNLD